MRCKNLVSLKGDYSLASALLKDILPDRWRNVPRIPNTNVEEEELVSIMTGELKRGKEVFDIIYVYKMHLFPQKY